MTGSKAEGKHIMVSEGQTLDTELVSLLDASGMEQESLLEGLCSLVAVQPLFDVGMVRLAAGQKIGSLRLGALRVEVLPRMAIKELTVLVRYALGGRIDAVGRTDLPKGKVGFEELLCKILADEATHIRQVGLSRVYEKKREQLPVLRGRPDFLASFPWDERRTSSLVCKYYLLTYNNPDNRLVRAALEMACLLEVSTSTKRRLLDHRQAWTAIAASSCPAHQDFEAARTRYTRLSEHYRLAHRLGQLLLTGLRPRTPGETDRETVGGFVIDMSWLFEKFVERLTAEIVSHLGMRVESQQRALLDANGKVYRRVRPDLVVYYGGHPVAIIDAKYKDYWRSTIHSGSPIQKISNEDIYQLFFYAQRLQCRYALPTPPKALIFSPLPAVDERGEYDLIDGRYAEVTWRAGGERDGQLHLVLVPMTATLRAMASTKDWMAQQANLVEFFRNALKTQTHISRERHIQWAGT